MVATDLAIGTALAASLASAVMRGYDGHRAWFGGFEAWSRFPHGAVSGMLNLFRAPESLPILNPSNFVPNNRFPVVKGLTTAL